MRRRTALTAALAGALLAPGVLAGATACAPGSKGTHTAPTPSAAPAPSTSLPPTPTPPSATSRPSGFSSQVLWPTANVSSTITAVHEHYLAGAAVVHDDLLPQTADLCPVVVDLDGPTTWAVLLDEEERMITKEVRLRDAEGLLPDPSPGGSASPSASSAPGGPCTVLRAGPSVIDGTSAYMVVATVRLSSPDETAFDSRTCPVSLVKVSLADGALEASTRVSEGLPLWDVAVLTTSRSPGEERLRNLFLSLSPDRASLLLSADPSSSASDTQPLGLRLSTQDLSVELDVQEAGRSQPLEVYGEAVTAPQSGSSVISLADGQETPLDDATPLLAWNGWLYYTSPAGTREASLYARDLASGQAVALDAPAGDWNLSYSWHQPRVLTDQRQLLVTEHTFLLLDPPTTTAAPPGWDGERAVPQAACVLGDVLYTTPPTEPGAAARVELTSTASGEPLGEVTGVGTRWPIAVTAWGLASGGSFFPATGWLDETAADAGAEQDG